MDPREEIRRRIDVADLIGESLQLKPAGGGSFKALCPFHMEKTPSFYVSREKQIWHCFGCGVGGDIFSFIMQMEGIDFPEALRVLAKRAGVEVPRFSTTQSNEKERLIRVNEFAAACYRKILSDSPAAAEARRYIEGRGITPELVEKFCLGFAPDAWDTFANLLAKKGIPAKEAERAGLLLPRRSGSGHIDRFRNRLMIPLRDVRGQTVGFTGRAMPGTKDGEGPKYLNSPETPVYHKSQLLFGLDLAKRAIKLEKAVIIVEGNLDVVASHKAGVENVVASSGTALTEEQLDSLRRLTGTLIFSFDQDAAGFNAAQRGIRLARQKDFQIRVALLPPEAGKDPDEAVQKDPALWRATVARTIPVMEYLIARATKGKDLSQVEVKREVSEVLLPELFLIQNIVEREHWLQTTADLLRVDTQILREAFGRAPSAKAARGLPSPSQRPAPKSQLGLAAELIFALFIQVPEFQSDFLPVLDPATLPAGELCELYEFLNSGYTYSRFLSGSSPSYFEWVMGAIKDKGHDSLAPLIVRLGIQGENLARALSSEQIRKELAAQLKILESGRREMRRKAIEAELRRAEGRGDTETVNKLLREYRDMN